MIYYFHKVTLARGTTKHYARLLFTVYCTIGKTCYPKMSLYCTQLDHANIGTYALGGRQCRKEDCKQGVRNLRSMNKLKDTLVLPCNERSHWSLFILKHHCTLYFDSIPRYHSTHKANQFVKCATLEWPYTKKNTT